MAASPNASNQSFTDIPLIFIPGTSGSSLDTSRSFTYEFQTDSHPGVGTHDHRPFDYNPGVTDPAGPRVWIGPEGIGTILQDTFNANRGNHYLDVFAKREAKVLSDVHLKRIDQRHSQRGVVHVNRQRPVQPRQTAGNQT